MLEPIEPSVGIAFTNWQRDLIRKDEGLLERQEAMLQALERGPEPFCNYLEEHLAIGSYRNSPKLSLHRELTLNEVSNPPVELERELYELWEHELTPNEACLPIYWYIMHTAWIRSLWFGSDLVKTFVHTSRSASDPMENQVDDRARSVMRRVGGLVEERGKVSVFSDCPMARAWWRRRISISVAEYSEGTLTADQAHIALHKKSAVWEPLVLNSLRRVTVVNNPRIRAAIVAHIASVDSIVSSGKICTRLVQDVARRCQFFTPQTWQDAMELVNSSAASVQAKAGESTNEDND